MWLAIDTETSLQLELNAAQFTLTIQLSRTYYATEDLSD